MKEETKTVSPDTVVGQAVRMKTEGYRLLTMTCVELDETSVDLLYHFDKNLALRHLRLTVAKTEAVPSISPVYFAAFLIENEIQDQFGIRFDGLVLDFGGTLYLEEEAVRTPFCRYTVSDKAAAEPAAIVEQTE